MRTRLVGPSLELPVIGQGTWGMGDDPRHRTRDIDALRLGLSLGMTLIDTAEIYGYGRSEEIVGEAVSDCRDQAFVVTKLWPTHASAKEVWSAVRACLKRMRTDYCDALLLHWPTRSVPPAESLSALARLQADGTCRFIGVSNFDEAWLRRTGDLPVTFNELPYSLNNRSIEVSLLGDTQRRGQTVLAYSPLGHGRHRRWKGRPVLEAIASRRGLRPEQIALAWVARHPHTIAIPKAVRPEHIRSNAAAGDVRLTQEELDEIGRAFPATARPFAPMLPPYALMHRLAWWGMGLSVKGKGPK